MAIRTSLDGAVYIKGDEKITMWSEDYPGDAIYFTLNGEEPAWNNAGPANDSTLLYDETNKPGVFPVDISTGPPFESNIDIETGLFTNHHVLHLFLRCKAESESTLIHELIVPFIYPVESNPPCIEIINNNTEDQEFDLVNPMNEDYHIKYKYDDEEDIPENWKEWEGPRRTSVDGNRVFVLIIQAKLQKKDDPGIESLIKTFAYVVKP